MRARAACWGIQGQHFERVDWLLSRERVWEARFGSPPSSVSEGEGST